MDEDFDDATPSAPVPQPTAAASAATTSTHANANVNPDEINLDDDDELMADVAPAPPAPPPPPPAHNEAGNGESSGSVIRVIDGKRMKRRETTFLALDKCLPRRRFLEVRHSSL